MQQVLTFLQTEVFGKSILLTLALILSAGFLVTRITKPLHLPNVTGYIFAGIFIGPYCLGLIPATTTAGMDFVTDMALAFIAFGVGKYFKLSKLKETGSKVLVITLFESLMAALVIALVMIFIFHLPVTFSILLGAIGCATAPASTIMTIRQYKAKGEFVNMILQVVALDDAVALIAFSVCAAVTQAINDKGAIHAWLVLEPILLNLLALGLGILGGFVLSRILNDKRSSDHRLVLVVAMVFLLTGLCNVMDISPMLSCMALGTAYINITGNKEVFHQLNGFTPPISLLFFVLSGMRLNVPALATAGVIGVAYFFVRIIGKYAGASLGSALCHADPMITKFLGLALVPQAGVSIGLAVLGQRLLSPELGSILSTIILSSAVLYETLGPAMAKLSLFLSHTIPKDAEKQKVEDGASEETVTPLKPKKAHVS